MATYSCGILYFIFPQIFSPISSDAIFNFIGVVFLTTFIIPLISILFLRFTKKISNLELSNKEDRILPFLSITGFYVVSTYLFISKLHVSRPMSVMMIVVTLLVGLILLISIRYKISVHAAGVWGTFGLFSALSIKYLNISMIGYLMAIVCVAGITSYSRLYLEKHTPAEVWFGSFLGFILCFTGIYLFA